VGWAKMAVDREVGRQAAKRENVFLFLFFKFSFYLNSSNSIFEQEDDIFSKWSKNESCSIFQALQLCQKVQSLNPNRF
jgi:hypothetical protein